MSKRIDVVFTKDLPGVAKIGDLKGVAGGFWRNFLLPRGFAVPAGRKEGRRFREKREQLDAKEVTAAERAEEGMKRAVLEREKTKQVREVKKQEQKTHETKKSARLKAKGKLDLSKET